MGLITKEVETKWCGSNRKWYEEKGYIYTKRFDVFKVQVEDLPNGSHVVVQVQCDGDNCDNKELLSMKWQTYLRYVKDDGKYYCTHCAGDNNCVFEKAIKTRIKNRSSLHEWCFENGRQDILDRWDYELNDYIPNEVTYCTSTKFWFKCPKNLHSSELKSIQDTVVKNVSIDCKACNSFAQWGIDNICEDFLEKYWDYEKNGDIDPWYISYSSNKKVWIKCQKKDYHEGYLVSIGNFSSNNSRCPYCLNQKVHPLDSLGKILEDKGLLYLWSDKNKKSPYKYAPMTHTEVWWKCLSGKHKDYKRKISVSMKCDLRCPYCSNYKGENTIDTYLKSHKIYNEPQKTFNELRGLGNGLLSYDFYLPEPYNLLIEYQGEFHDGNGNSFVRQNINIQQEHDRRKREYAHNNNIKLLEIWYWDFGNIEEILDNELNIKI